jgi:hypothetical protein
MSEEYKTSYSGVTLSNDEMASLVTDESPIENQGESPAPVADVDVDQSSQLEEVSTEGQDDHVEIESLELDGNEYDMETISQALEAYNNRSDWQKSNTEKAQEISAERKAFEAESKVWKDLQNDENAIEALREILDADHPIFNPGKAEELQTQDTKDPDRIQELEDKLEEFQREREEELEVMEADKQVTSDLATLQQNHPELQDQDLMDEVITTAIEKGFTGIDGLEDAFVLAYHTSAEDSAFKTAVNRARNAKAMKSIPEPEGAVKGIHEEPVTKPKDYRDARADALKNYNFFE